MRDHGTALALKLPDRLAGRALRWFLYVVVLLIFVTPLWSILTTTLSGVPLKVGQLTLLPTKFTMSNLTAAWHFGVGRGLLNSSIVVGVALFLQVTVSAFAAYALARKRFRFMGLVTLLILATMMMPEEIIAIPLYLVLHAIPEPFTGGTLLNSFGGLILPLVGWALPIYVLTQFMRTIPTELEESARVDGAGEFTIFFRIILPLCKPALGTCAVFGFLMIWDQYLLPLLVTQTPNMYTLTLVVTNLQSSQELGQGVRLAAALVLLVPSIVVYLGLQRFFERGLLTGSLKG